MPDIRLSRARGPFVRLALEGLGALPRILRWFRQWLTP
jgi:hypothetical protein